jgi:D-alanyl-D-alanine carboxypeptidase
MMLRRFLFVPALMAFALGSACGVAGCSTSTEAAPAAPAATTQPPVTMPSADPDAGAPKPPVKTACDLENDALQAGLDHAHDKTTGAVLAVRNACGVRTLTSGQAKLDPKSLHRIGSVTKTYVAAVILGLLDDGTITLDDVVSKWIPDVTLGGDVITIRQLLDHSSGLFNYTDDKAFQKTPTTKVFTPAELVAVSMQHPVDFAPGAKWEYSNTNYIVLGMIAEAAGKAPIAAQIRSRVLAKAGLTSTFFAGGEPVTGTMAPGQNAGGEDATNALDPSWSWAAGAMVASPADVATWIEKVGNGTFYDAPTQKLLLDGALPTTEPGLTYGLGIFGYGASITGGAGMGIGHGGDIAGYHTEAIYFPASKTTLVAIVDSDAEDANDVVVATLGVLFK